MRMGGSWYGPRGRFRYRMRCPPVRGNTGHSPISTVPRCSVESSVIGTRQARTGGLNAAAIRAASAMLMSCPSPLPYVAAGDEPPLTAGSWCPFDDSCRRLSHPPTRWAARRGRRAQHEPTASPRMLRTADRPPCSRVAQRQLGHHLTWLAGSLQPPRPCVRCFALDYGYRLSVVHEQTRVPASSVSQFRQMAKRPGNCCEVMKSKSAGQAIHRGVAAGHGEGADSYPASQAGVIPPLICL